MHHQDYKIAKQIYADFGVDTDAALKKLETVSISLHCWQGDDVGGFETKESGLAGGGIMATGNYPGKARTPEELRQDLDQTLSLIPGTHRLNLHASYGETGGNKVERNEYTTAHFQNWIDWCKARGLGMDFNPTYYAHPLANSGFTLSHADKATRRFWVEHGIACRKIGADIGKQLAKTCVTNFWIPDGSKDLPADRKAPRLRLEESLDQIFAAKIDPALNLDAVESKLFGIGSESYVVGSQEFYLGYAIKNGKLICLDAGHYHPTESVADKISSVLQFVPELLLHVSRGVRWDSDHVVILDDPTRAIMEELVRGDFLARTHIGLDFFDASINRITAWVVGARSAIKALLFALLDPIENLRQLEAAGDFGSRLALMEEAKSMPFSAVWEEYCTRKGVAAGASWLEEAKAYEAKVLSKRQ